MLQAMRRCGAIGASRCGSPSLGPWCSRLISGLGRTMPSPKSLDDILKLDTLADKTPEEIEAIWMEVRACLHFYSSSQRPSPCCAAATEAVAGLIKWYQRYRLDVHRGMFHLKVHLMQVCACLRLAAAPNRLSGTAHLPARPPAHPHPGRDGRVGGRPLWWMASQPLNTID